jgi:type IV secretory pathway VirB10-like protein
MREPRTVYQVVVRIRTIDIFAVVSILLHAVFFLFMKPMVKMDPEGPVSDRPLNVVLAPPQADPVAPVTPAPPAEAAPTPPRVIARIPSPQAPRFPTPVVPPVTQPTEPAPVAPREPLVDMMAAIQANRTQREAAESALARGNPSSEKGEDPLSRNMRTLSGREGVGGVFQIMRKGLRTGEFAFNGFRNSGQRQWREVIEVDAGPGGDIELAMIRRMIELIRGHYSGDFRWDSYRLGRVVVLSARPQDQPGLEEFLMKEFFAAPPPPPGPRAGRSPR